MEKDFNTYWEEKAQKRRKSLAAKAKRYAEQHTQLEDIRREVFLPIDYTPGFELDDYKVLHYTKKNPIVDWQSGWSFAFSEDNLRQAMEAEGADMNSFKMEINRHSLVANDITFKLWDDTKISEKVKSLVDRYYYNDVDSVLKSALKPWMTDFIGELKDDCTITVANQVTADAIKNCKDFNPKVKIKIDK